MINFDPWGFVQIFFALILMSALQVAGALAAMYALHQKRPLQELVIRWGAIIVPAVMMYMIATWFFDVKTQMATILSFAVVSFGILAALFTLHKNILNATYGLFDFDNFQIVPFQELVIRLVIVFLPVTFLLHLLDYLFIGRSIIKYTWGVYIILFVLEVGAIAAGFFLILKLDRVRALTHIAVSAIIYLFMLWYLVGRAMLY